MSRETDRLLELAAEIGQRLGGALHDIVPPEAERHLLTAQKELLTALVLIYEQQAGARRPPRQRAGQPDTPSRRRRTEPREPSPRSQRIDIE